MLRRSLLQLLGATLVSPAPAGASDAARARHELGLPVMDRDRRIRSRLPPGWSLVPCCELCCLDLADATGRNRLYLRTYPHDEYLAEGLEADTARRMYLFPETFEVRRVSVRRRLEVGGRQAIQCAASVRLSDSRPYAYCATFIDSGDRRDELVVDGPHLASLFAVADAFLEDLEFVVPGRA
jgi:hypothetical protein